MRKRTVVGNLDALLAKTPKIVGTGMSSVLKGKPSNVLAKMGLPSLSLGGRMFPKTKKY